MCGDFCLSRPALTRSRFGFVCRLAPSPACRARGPVIVPDGRVTRRLTSSARTGFAARGCRLDAVCESLPRRRVRFTPRRRRRSPPALRNHFRKRPRVGGDGGEDTRGGGGGDNFRAIFLRLRLSSATAPQLRDRFNIREVSQHASFLPPAAAPRRVHTSLASGSRSIPR
jgi:hypothetical protein